MKKLIIIVLTSVLSQSLVSQVQENYENLKMEQLHPIYLKYGLDTLKSKIGEIINIDSLSFPPYKVLQYYFRERNQEKPWPYGFGYLIADDSKQNKVIWYNLIYGDFGPHTFSWVDFDGDGDKDLFHLIGFEDVFESRLYLNQINTNPSHPFKMIYENNIAYCALVDFNKDGIPEILNQIKKEEEGYADYNPALNYEMDDEQKEKIVQEYDRIIGDFDKCNFDYNMPNHYKEFSIVIHADVNILSVKNDTIVDASENYPDHFCFRADILKNVKNAGELIKPWLSELENKYRDKYYCEK
jgi:hypothetical protein